MSIVGGYVLVIVLTATAQLAITTKNALYSYLLRVKGTSSTRREPTIKNAKYNQAITRRGVE